MTIGDDYILIDQPPRAEPRVVRMICNFDATDSRNRFIQPRLCIADAFLPYITFAIAEELECRAVVADKQDRARCWIDDCFQHATLFIFLRCDLLQIRIGWWRPFIRCRRRLRRQLRFGRCSLRFGNRFRESLT